MEQKDDCDAAGGEEVRKSGDGNVGKRKCGRPSDFKSNSSDPIKRLSFGANEKKKSTESEGSKAHETVKSEAEAGKKKQRRRFKVPQKGLGATKKRVAGPPPPKTKKSTPAKKPAEHDEDKPFLSSKLGDMVRLILKMACKESTQKSAPPVEFYDFLHRWSEPNTDTPSKYAELKGIPMGKLQKITASLDALQKGRKDADDSFPEEEMKKGPKTYGTEDSMRRLGPTLAELLKGARTSLSSVSFISSSTKLSDSYEKVILGEGWGRDEAGGDASSSDSEIEDEAASAVHYHTEHSAEPSEPGGGGEHSLIPPSHAPSAAGSKSRASDISSGTSFHIATEHVKRPEELVAESLQRLELEEARQKMEWAQKAKDAGVIDHFLQDMDDSFLLDRAKYGQPGPIFTDDFDFYNEDKIFHRLLKMEEDILPPMEFPPKATKAPVIVKRTSNSDLDLSPSLIMSDISEDEEEGGKSEENLAKNKVRRGTSDTKGKGSKGISPPPVVEQKENYETCLARQKEMVEERLKEAVMKRDGMGNYIPPPGELPLARTFDFVTPGPGDYFPNINAVKPGPKGIFLTKRWSKSIYETPGPGPGAFNLRGKCPAPCNAKMLTLHESQRFPSYERAPGPGPCAFDISAPLGKTKPHALIIPRRPPLPVGSGEGTLTNVYGMTRFGKAGSRKALIVSRHELKKRKKDENEGTPTGLLGGVPEIKDTRIGITMKSRIPPLQSATLHVPFVDLPSTLGKRTVPLGIRKFPNSIADSPGPIYDVHNPETKGFSLTFRPFPLTGRDDDPSPNHYGAKAGEQCIKMTKFRAPTPKLMGSHDLKYENSASPGPKYHAGKCDFHTRCNIGITMKQRYKFRPDAGIPGPEYLPGTSHLPRPPRVLIQGKWNVSKKEKQKLAVEKCDWNQFDLPEDQRKESGAATASCRSLLQRNPVDNPFYKVPGGMMLARWESGKMMDMSPPMQNLFGKTNKGAVTTKIPISLKSRQSPFVYTKIAKYTEIPNQQTCDIQQRRRNETECRFE